MRGGGPCGRPSRGSTPWPAFLPALGPIWYTEKRNTATTTATRTRLPATWQTQTPAQGGHTMRTLLLNSLQVTLPALSLLRKQHALTRSLSWLTTTTLEKRRPSISKQPAQKQKNSEQNAHYLLTILTRRADKRAPPMHHRLGRPLPSSCCPPCQSLNATV
jgi:hypothetical protein